jgi:hypothetical protein
LWHPGARGITARAFSPDGRYFLTGGLDGSVWQWRVPVPLRGDPEHIKLRVQVATGLEPGEGKVIRLLDAEEWKQWRQRLEKRGGPPVP